MGGSVTVYTDGASEGNPGRAGAAYVLLGEDGGEIERGSKPLGSTTNNVAEYQGLILGLRAARSAKATSVLVRMDSELVVRQMQGSYKVKSADLRPFYDQAQALAGSFARVRFEHVPRERNRLADSLASAACALNGSGAGGRTEYAAGRSRPDDAMTDLGRIRTGSQTALEVSLVPAGGAQAVRLSLVAGDGRPARHIDVPAAKLGELLDALELGWAYLHDDSAAGPKAGVSADRSIRGKRRA